MEKKVIKNIILSTVCRKCERIKGGIMVNKKSTGKFDIEGKEIFEGDILKYEDINGNVNEFVVKWSNFWGKFIGDSKEVIGDNGELYDLKSDYFYKTIKLN